MAYVLVSTTKRHEGSKWFNEAYSNANVQSSTSDLDIKDWVHARIEKRLSNLYVNTSNVYNRNTNISVGNSNVHHHHHHDHNSNANVITNNSNIISNSSNINIGNTNVSVSYLAFSNLNKWIESQTGFKLHTHQSNGDVVIDVYIFDTQTNGDAFKSALDNNLIYQAIISYYDAYHIHQHWMTIL